MRGYRSPHRPRSPNSQGEVGRCKLACSVAKHNACHFGQTVVLRRLFGAWDETAREAGMPPSG